MPNINTAMFTLTDGTTKRSLGARLQDKWITVKDFGATGNGDDDDTLAIQAALDFAYGPKEAPHGSTALSNDVYTFHTGILQFTNRPVYFPPGNYKITSMLRINVGYGVNLIGAGSQQTRLFWSGAEEAPPAEQVSSVLGSEDPREFIPDTTSALITLYMSWSPSITGITFDASNTQDVALRIYHWPAHISNEGEDPTDLVAPFETTVGDDGSGGVIRDCVFTNARTGFLAAGAKMGSERTFISCKFTNCEYYGHGQFFQNALNHWFHGCHFEGNTYGHHSGAAGHGTFNGCTFADNSGFDIFQQYGGTLIQNCSSTSPNFVCADGHLIGNRHVHGSEGTFHCSVHTNPITSATPGTNAQRNVFVGNYSSNGVFGLGNVGIYLKGNTFGNADYLDTPMGGATQWIFEDGTMLKEP